MSVSKYVALSTSLSFPLNRFPFLSRLLLFLVFPCIAVIVGFRVYLTAGLPSVDGNVPVLGISAPVNIHRDVKGVVTIESKTDTDAFFAAGYVHAQDRLWQLEFKRRFAQGRLSEILGKKYVDHDIWFRTLDLTKSAEESWGNLSAECKQALEAYARGINAWTNEKHTLPLEFSLFSIKPTPWRPSDSIVMSKLYALTLGQNYVEELKYSFLVRHLTRKQFQFLLPDYPSFEYEELNTVLNSFDLDLNSAIEISKHLHEKYSIGARSVGSNAWVVSQNHDGTGGALLANDPHLLLEAPSPWYAISYRSDRLNATGMSLVGMPMVIAGRNSAISWGLTNMGADTQDLYIERVSTESSNQYSNRGVVSEFETKKTIVHIKRDMPGFLHRSFKPVVHMVRRTVNGPIINEGRGQSPVNPISLQATFLDYTDTSVEAFLDLNYATDWQSFRSALIKLVAPALNVFYADHLGNIGYQGAGRIPIRNNGYGLHPVDGSLDKNYWREYIAFDEMPRAYNPKIGYLLNGNNEVSTYRPGHHLSYTWANPARSRRIEELLKKGIQSNDELSVDYMLQIQNDTLDLVAKQFLPIANDFETKDPSLREAHSIIKAWDGAVRSSSQAATIYHVWLESLKKNIFLDEFQPASSQDVVMTAINDLISSLDASIVIDAIRNQDMGWCDIKYTDGTESCDDMLERSLAEAVKFLDQQIGADVSLWHWGAFVKIKIQHAGLENIRLLNERTALTVEGRGSSYTVNAARIQQDQSGTYYQNGGPSFRQIVAFEDTEPVHVLLNTTGQSGNMASDNFRDMFDVFYSQKAWTNNPIEADHLFTLTLEPLSLE